MNIKPLAIIAIAAFMTHSCTDGGSCSRQTDATDSIACPTDSTATADTTLRADTIAEPVERVRTITGIAVDGGMNSIDMVVGKDTLSFDFPDLPEHVTWTAGDTMTIVVDTATDSVLSLRPGK